MSDVKFLGHDAAGYEVWQIAPGRVIGAAAKEDAQRYAKAYARNRSVGVDLLDYVRKYGPIERQGA